MDGVGAMMAGAPARRLQQGVEGWNLISGG